MFAPRPENLKGPGAWCLSHAQRLRKGSESRSVLSNSATPWTAAHQASLHIVSQDSLHHILEFAPTCVHWVSDAIQPSHPLFPPSPLALSLSQHQGLLQRVDSSHKVAKVLELQHQSFQ